MNVQWIEQLRSVAETSWSKTMDFVRRLRSRPTFKGKVRYLVSFTQRFFKSEKNIYALFQILLAIKGIIAAVEFIGGMFLYFVSQQFLLNLIILATQGELREDPRDLIANTILHTAENLSTSTQHLTALYLIGHGIVKLFLIAGLLREKLVYYPIAIVIFGLFIAYELYQFSITFSIWLLLIAFLDFLVVWLTWHEYKYIRAKVHRRSALLRP